jgi:tetratricopeptide (TPR) repeat protein
MRFTIAASAILAAWCSATSAGQSAAYSRCVELTNRFSFEEATPFCEQAATEDGDEGLLLYGQFVQMAGLPEDAQAIYSHLLLHADLSNPTAAQRAALRRRAMMGFESGSAAADADAAALLELVPGDVELLRAGAQGASSAAMRIEYADRLIALDPKVVDYHVLRSYALSAASQPAKALAAAETALQLDPDSALALTARGFAHAAGGDLATALRDHTAAAGKAPNESGPWTNVASTLFELGRYADAIQAAGEALEIEPIESRALLIRASAYLKTGNAERAIADLRVVEENYDDTSAPDLLEQARSITASRL